MKNNYPFFFHTLPLLPFLSITLSIITMLYFPGASVMTTDLHVKNPFMNSKERSICPFTAYGTAMCLGDLSSVESRDGGWGKCSRVCAAESTVNWFSQVKTKSTKGQAGISWPPAELCKVHHTIIMKNHCAYLHSLQSYVLSHLKWLMEKIEARTTYRPIFKFH